MAHIARSHGRAATRFREEIGLSAFTLSRRRYISADEKKGDGMGATGGSAFGVSFEKVEKLGAMGPAAAKQLRTAHRQLRDGGAPKAAGRLHEIDNYLDKLDYSGLESIVDPEQVEDELAASRQGRVRRAHIWRNTTALIPLLLTWVALSAASWEYAQDLNHHSGDSTQPFLLLWERGFGHHGLWYPTFAKVAFVDFLILGIVLFLTVWVHRVESADDKSRTEVVHGLWAALNSLKVAIDASRPRTPATAEEWADAARSIIADAMEQTKLLTESGRQAIDEASSRLADLQDQGRDFIRQFSVEIQSTLVAVREQNEQFISRVTRESRETLQRMVEQQMEPLLQQLSTMLAEFGRHQETYRAGVADLSQGVNSIKGSAQELAESARGYRGVADSISAHLESIDTSQHEFTSLVGTSASSMQAAATAMGAVKDVLQTGLQNGVREMAYNVSEASKELEVIEKKLASTSTALDRSATNLNRAAANLSRPPGGRRPRWHLFGR